MKSFKSHSDNPRVNVADEFRKKNWSSDIKDMKGKRVVVHTHNDSSTKTFSTAESILKKNGFERVKTDHKTTPKEDGIDYSERAHYKHPSGARASIDTSPLSGTKVGHFKQ